jgi:tape measure domain-containing protein
LAQTIFNRDKSMADDLNAKFTLKAQTEGGEQIREIADDVRSVGDGAHEASPRMTELGDAATRTGGNLDTAGQAARALGKYLATAFTARELVQAAAEMEKLRAGLQAVAGDADKAAKELAFVRDIAARAGVDVADASKAYLGLAAATKGTAVEGQATRDVFEAVSVAMARAGKSSGETANALLALQQMAGKGVVSMEEMRQQLGEALPGAFQAAAKGMGVTTQELIKLIETGQVTAQDIFPALTRGLNELYAGAPQAQTLAQEITNIKNAFVEMADNIGQAGGGNALKAFAEGAQTALTFLDAALVATGKKIGVLVGAFAAMDFSGLKTAFAEIESEAQTKLAKAAQHNDVLRASLQAVGGEATQAALAMQQAGAAAQQGAAQADASAVSYQALGAAYKKVRDELAQQIDLAERDVKAAKARGDAAVAQARLLGDEAALRAAIGQAAQGEAQALATLAQQRQTEVDVLRAELNNKLALLAAGGQVSDERKKELQALEALIAQKQIDADATAAQAAAAQASARAKGPEAQAAEQVRVAAQASAVARKSEADAAINLLAHSRGLAQQSEQMARLMGDETSARRERIRQMEIDAQITRAKAEVQRVEAEGSIAVARATLAEMAAKGEANAVKQAELEASIKLAEARLKEVDLLKQAASAAEFAVARQRDLGEASAQAAEKAAAGAKTAGDAAEEAGKKHEQVGKTIQFTWVSAAAAASRYKDEAIAHANALEGKWQSLSALGSAPMSWGMYFEAWNNHFDTLTRLADEYVATMEALDRQQQAIERTNIGAARSVDALKLRLIELNGTEEQVAAARRERDEAEVRRQIKLAEIEAARAAARNDEGEIARYREEIALLGEQLTLLGKVYAAEQKQRAVKARGDEGGSGGGGGGVSAGPATMNVTLNANGISDPVKLARMIEPELARLQRLAR